MHNPFKKKCVRAVCILSLLLTVAFYDVVFLKKTFKVTTANSQALPNGVYGQADNKPRFIPVNGTDSPVLEEPVYEFIKQNLKQGILPLWNPHQACGYPLIGMLQVGIFFPLNLILYLLPQIVAWDVLILLRLLLAGLFTFWFMRTLGFKEIPSLCSGLVFMLSGPMVLLQYWTVNVDLLVPVLLIAGNRLLQEIKACNLAFLALTIGLTILAGHPEHIFLVNVYGVCFFLFRFFSLRKKINCKKAIIYFLSAYLLGVGLSAIVLFPFLRNLLFEFWHGHPEGVGLLMEEQRDRALTLALPHFFQQVPLTYQWVFSGWWGGYLGTLPLGLAFLSLFNRHKKGLNYFLACLAFIIIGKEYGLPIINWIGYLPLFNMCRYAIHTPHLAALTIALLAGMGVRTILFNKNIFSKGLIYSLILLCIVAVHLIVLRTSDTFPIALKASLFALGILTVFQALLFMKDKKIINKQSIGIILVVVVFAELFSYIHRERPRRFDSFAKVPYIEALKSSTQRIRSYGQFWAFYPNTATGFGVDDLGYFFGLVPKRFVTFVNHLMIKDHFKNDNRPPALRAIPIQGKDHWLDLLNVKYIIAPATDRFSKIFNHFEDISKKFKTVYTNEVRVFERPNAFPRVFVVHRAVFQADEDKSLNLLNRMKTRLRRMVVINHPAISEIEESLKDTPVVDQSKASIIKYTPNEVLINAHLEHAGFLVLSDAFHPDWKVIVDGREERIFQTDYLLRSVFLEGGQHKVRFVFRPLSFYLGGIVSLVALLILFSLFFRHRLRVSISS